MYSACTINGKAVKCLYINGRLVYSTEPDQMALANAEAMSGSFGSKDVLGDNSYTYQGQTYNYKVYDMPSTPTWSPIGAGNDNPWFAAPGLVVCAAHWAGSLKTGIWAGSGGLTYNVSSWTNLRTWALANGFTEDDLRGMSDIRDIVVAVCGAGTSDIAQSECPYFMSKELVKKAFWNGSMRGTVGYHTPQKSIDDGGTNDWTCYPSADGEGNEYYIMWQEAEPEGHPDGWSLNDGLDFVAGELTDTNIIFQNEGVVATREFEAWTTDPATYNGQPIEIRPDVYEGEFYGWQPFAGDSYFGASNGNIDSDWVEWTAGGECDINLTAVRSVPSGGDMELLAPVVMQSDFSWQTPKDGYSAIPSRDNTTKSTAQSYDNTYLAYVGDSGKPTFVKIGQYDVVASQCFSQFAGPDFSACLPVLDAFAKANGKTLNVLMENMLPTS